MADHIASVAESGIPKVTKAEMYGAIHPGDLLLCSGADGISVPIEKETNSPFSHVLMLWVPSFSSEWLTLESTIDKGVHIGRAGDYVDGYDGELVLCRRPVLSLAQIEAELNVGFALLDDKYDWIEEVSMATRKVKLLSGLPVIKPSKELYCSGLQQMIALKTLPFSVSGPDWATPEQIFTDPSVTAVCALLKSA